MARYYFHLVRSGLVIPDPEGTELANADEARREAVLNARDLIIRILKTDDPVPLDDHFRVVDEHGCVLFTVTLREALGLPAGGG